MIAKVREHSGNFLIRADTTQLRNVWTRTSPIILYVIGMLIFYRRAFRSRFRLLSGEYGDMRLISVIHEHWFDAIRGKEGWRDLPAFYPSKGILGYSDTFALNAPPYIMFRSLGIDRWRALELVLMALSTIGFFGLYILLRQVSDLSKTHRSLLAFLFAFANPLGAGIGHPQLLFVLWLPWIVVFAVKARAASTNLARGKYAVSAGTLLGLVTWSGYYVGWFAIFSCCVICAAVLVVRGIGRQDNVARLPFATWKLTALGAVSGLAGFGIAMIPFLATYLPVLRVVGERNLDFAKAYAPTIGDTVNIGNGNLLWAPTLRSLFGFSENRLAKAETSFALTPTLLVVVFFAWLFVVYKRMRGQRTIHGDYAIAVGIGIAFLRFVTINFSSVYGWKYVFAYFPGATAIRATDRIQTLSYLFGALTLALAVQSSRLASVRLGGRRHGEWRSRIFTAALTAVLLVICVEQMQRNNSRLRSDRSLAVVRQMPSAPLGCEVFYLRGVEGSPIAETNIDAMIIAQELRVKTINGYSGQFPPGFFPDPTNREYQAEINARLRQLPPGTALCSLDPHGQWRSE